MLCGSLDGGQWGRMDTCICRAESLHCSLETVTVSLTGCTSIQDKKFIKKETGIRLKNNGWFEGVSYLCHISIHGYLVSTMSF